MFNSILFNDAQYGANTLLQLEISTGLVTNASVSLTTSVQFAIDAFLEVIQINDGLYTSYYGKAINILFNQALEPDINSYGVIIFSEDVV